MANSTTDLGGDLEAGTGCVTARSGSVHRCLLRWVMPRGTEREKEGKVNGEGAHCDTKLQGWSSSTRKEHGGG